MYYTYIGDNGAVINTDMCRRYCKNHYKRLVVSNGTHIILTEIELKLIRLLGFAKRRGSTAGSAAKKVVTNFKCESSGADEGDPARPDCKLGSGRKC